MTDAPQAAPLPVVVGVDGSYPAIRAARWAAAVAQRMAAPLKIVNAKPYLGRNFSDAIANLRAAQIVAQEECADAILAAAEHAVRADHPDLAVTTERASQPADQALAELSRHARLVVLGCDEVSLGKAILIGSTTMAVATHAACPVVAFRGDLTAPSGQPVVVGVDGDPSNHAALAAAFEFAQLFGVAVLAVHAWSTRRPPGDVTLPVMIDWKAIEDGEQTHLEHTLAPWRQRYPDVPVSSVVDPDKPSRALMNHAADAQLAVVGSRGRNLLAGAVLGSTGLNLLHHSAVPVMICRGAEVDEN